MKRKLRWFALDGPAGFLRDLSKAVLKTPYDDRSGKGFLVHESNRTTTAGVYIEKIDLRYEVEDPWGKRVVIKQVDYRRVPFAIDPARSRLELQDAPRSVGEMFDVFAAAGNAGTQVSKIDISVKDWLRAIERKKTSLQVRSMWLSNAPIAADVRANIELRGKRDVQDAAKRWLSKGVAVIEAVDVAWRTPDGDDFVVCRLSRGGATFDERWEEDAAPVLRDTLPALPAA